MNRNITLAVAAFAFAATAAVAYAAKAAVENDALAAAQAKVTLVQAIAAAEQHAGGKATKAEYEHAKQGSFYEVEVMAGSKVFDVRVDADKGTVVSSTEDRND
ncbi:MAG: PepSY domain-containing protein [Rubrivivax sp.]